MNRVLAVLALSFALACAHHHAETNPTAPAAPKSKGPGALASIESRSGSTLVGTARFTPGEKGGVVAHIVIAGATPGEHGVHIHEKGDCSDSKAASAGGHFNPGESLHHGGTTGADRHGGDLGNITVDDKGNGELDVAVAGINVNGEDHGIVGRSIVVHEKTDDLHSDPSGNSGSRIGCGVIVSEK